MGKWKKFLFLFCFPGLIPWWKTGGGVGGRRTCTNATFFPLNLNNYLTELASRASAQGGTHKLSFVRFHVKRMFNCEQTDCRKTADEEATMSQLKTVSIEKGPAFDMFRSCRPHVSSTGPERTIQKSDFIRFSCSDIHYWITAYYLRALNHFALVPWSTDNCITWVQRVHPKQTVNIRLCLGLDSKTNHIPRFDGEI